MRWFCVVALCFGFLAASVDGQEFLIPASTDSVIHDQGALGFQIITDGTVIQTSRSGGSNDRRGMFEFDISAVPSSLTLSSAALQVVTTQLIANTGSTATVDFIGYEGDGIIEETDFDSPVANVSNTLRSVTFDTGGNGPPEGSPLNIFFDNLLPLQQAISSGASNFTIRSQTVNFVTFQIAALENMDNFGAAQLVLNYELACDFDEDNVCGTSDIDLLVAALVGGSPGIEFDIDESGAVDYDDVLAWLDRAGHENLPSRGSYLLGDANLDGFVDGTDFIEWNNNKFTGTAMWSAGDFNADGFVDGVDFISWNNNKFAAADGIAVPEPTGWLAWLILGFVLRLRRHP